MSWAMENLRSAWGLFSGTASAGTTESADSTCAADARAEAHALMVASETEAETRTKADLFKELVRINRANGVDPSQPEPDGPIGYEHSHLVPMQGDPYWVNGRTISRDAIDRRFRKATP